MRPKCWRVVWPKVDQMEPRVKRLADSISEIVVVRFDERVSSEGSFGASNFEDSIVLSVFKYVFV